MKRAKMRKMKMSDILRESSLIFNCQLAVNELTLNVTALLNTDAEREFYSQKTSWLCHQAVATVCENSTKADPLSELQQSQLWSNF